MGGDSDKELCSTSYHEIRSEQSDIFHNCSVRRVYYIGETGVIGGARGPGHI